jgi:hypothetical protein
LAITKDTYVSLEREKNEKGISTHYGEPAKDTVFTLTYWLPNLGEFSTNVSYDTAETLVSKFGDISAAKMLSISGSGDLKMDDEQLTLEAGDKVKVDYSKAGIMIKSQNYY